MVANAFLVIIYRHVKNISPDKKPTQKLRDYIKNDEFQINIQV